MVDQSQIVVVTLAVAAVGLAVVGSAVVAGVLVWLAWRGLVWLSGLER